MIVPSKLFRCSGSMQIAFQGAVLVSSAQMCLQTGYVTEQLQDLGVPRPMPLEPRQKPESPQGGAF